VAKIDVDWSIPKSNQFDQALRRFLRYLEDQGHRQSTIEGYLGNVKRYLVFSGTDRPSLQNWQNFKDQMHDRRLSRSTLNQNAYSARAYHRMLGGDLPVKRLEPHNEIPHYFDEEDIIKIFSVIPNLKHLAMLETIFFACIRVSELINLNDADIDLKNYTIRINEGKGGRAGIAYLSDEAVSTLQQYLAIRPSIEVDGKRPLFYTTHGKRWTRTEVSRMFSRYKKTAGVIRPGGIHVFGRHSPASILIKNGCDILTVKELLRHKDITTTARYLHIDDNIRRLKYNKFLRL
jgi:integrase/recombinase XerD